jgi:hypothetical protein
VTQRQQLSCAGYYLFGRRNGLNKLAGPGVSRAGQFCAVSLVKAKYTEEQILNSIKVTTVCNGEDMVGSQKPVA